MKELIPYHYKLYGDYVNKEKMLPSKLDGLLTVHRRLLVTLHLVANNEYTKTAKVLGELMARFHPHTIDVKVPGTLVKNDLADGQGNWGTYFGSDHTEPAAPRYTSIKANKFIENIALKYVRDIPWEYSESDPEPKILPSAFPLCLLGKFELDTMGFGFKCNIPVFEKKDLYKRLLFLLGHRKTEPIIKPIIDNGGCEILSSDSDIKKILNTGEGSLDIKGTYTINENKKEIIVHGWSSRRTFGNLLSKINKPHNILDNGDVAYIDISEKNKTAIMFHVIKKRNTEDIFNKLKESVENALYAKINYSAYVVNEKSEVELASIDSMLLMAYKYYTYAMKTNAENNIKKLNNSINELKIIKKMKPHLSDYMKKYKDINDCLKELSKKIQEPEEDLIKIVDKYKIKKLLTTSVDTTELNDKLSFYKEKIKDPSKTALEEYKDYI